MNRGRTARDNRFGVESPRNVIADPQAFIPANRMPYAGMSNASDRADLIAYLQKATQ
jgi:cytochrome c